MQIIYCIFKKHMIKWVIFFKFYIADKDIIFHKNSNNKTTLLDSEKIKVIIFMKNSLNKTFKLISLPNYKKLCLLTFPVKEYYSNVRCYSNVQVFIGLSYFKQKI